MSDIVKTCAPKSDQLNADDLIGGRALTIKITKVSLLGGDQPVALNYEGDNNKPYKPCKSMRRLLVHAWGGDGSKYVGRSLTLYCDPKVKFGGVEVGGIRISHMSDIAEPLTIALTVSKAVRKPFVVKPLAQSEPTQAKLSVPELIAQFEAARTIEQFDAAEKVRASVWKNVEAALKTSLKAASNVAKKRFEQPAEPEPEQEPEPEPLPDYDNEPDLASADA